MPNLYKFIHGRTYFFERQVRGNRVRVGLGRNFAEASRKAVELNTRIERGEPPARIRLARLSVSEFFAQARNSVRQQAPKTQASYRNRAAQFMAYLDECHPTLRSIGEVTRAIADDYFRWRGTRTVSRNGKAATTACASLPSRRTIRDDCITLRTMFRRAAVAGDIPTNPFDGIRFSKRKRSEDSCPYHVNQAQVVRLLATAKRYDALQKVDGRPSTFRGLMHDMTLLYLMTGLRKDELIHLPWQHVELDKSPHGLLHVRPVDIPVSLSIKIESRRLPTIRRLVSRGKDRLFPSEQQLRAVVPSNYVEQERDALLALQPDAWDDDGRVLRVHTRIQWKQKATAGSIPLNKTAHDVLLRRKNLGNPSPFVFSHPDGGPLRSDYWAQFKIILGMAGLPRGIKVHDLRHTFAFEMLERGVALQELMYLMRHADIRETMVYARCTPEQAARAITRLDGFGCE